MICWSTAPMPKATPEIKYSGSEQKHSVWHTNPARPVRSLRLATDRQMVPPVRLLQYRHTLVDFATKRRRERHVRHSGDVVPQGVRRRPLSHAHGAVALRRIARQRAVKGTWRQTMQEVRISITVLSIEKLAQLPPCPAAPQRVGKCECCPGPPRQPHKRDPRQQVMEHTARQQVFAHTHTQLEERFVFCFCPDRGDDMRYAGAYAHHRRGARAHRRPH